MEEIDWNEVATGSLASLERVVLASSTSVRRQGLNELHEKIAGKAPHMFSCACYVASADHSRARVSASQLPPAACPHILLLLFRTYPLYVDRASRQCVQRCLRSLFAAETTPPNILPAFVHKLKKESEKAGIASVNSFVLVEWCCLLLQHLSVEKNYDAQLVQDVVSANARALELTLAGSTKEGLTHSAVIVTRRALRAAFSSTSHGQDIIKLAVDFLAKSPSASPKNAPFLGVVAGVTARQPTNKPVMESLKADVLAYFAKEIIASRVILPSHITDGLNDFFVSFVTLDDLRTSVFPSLEKAMLRAPEVVLNGVILSLANAIPSTIDISEDVSSRFTKPLLSSLKSTNANVRSGAFNTMVHLVSCCKEEKPLLKIVDETLGPVKTNKIPNAEQRSLHVQALGQITCSKDVSLKVLADLASVFTREANEAALEAEVKALMHHLGYVIRSGLDISKETLTSITTGCGDKRLNFRKLWLLNSAQLIWDLTDEQLGSSESVLSFVSTILSKNAETYKDISTNPLPSLQNGTVSLGYAFTALTCGRLRGVSSVKGSPYVADESVGRAALTLTPKSSFLLTPKVYTKLTAKDDFIWEIRALSAVVHLSSFSTEAPSVKNAWAQAFIYLLSANNTPPRTRELSLKALSEVYTQYPDIVGDIIIEGLWTWLHDLSREDKESAAVASGAKNVHLSLAIKAITPTPGDNQDLGKLSAREIQLVKLLILCHQQLIKGSRWIDVVLRSKIDPAYLVSQNPEACLKEVTSVSDDPLRSSIDGAKSAAWDAVADLVFVAPDVMVSRVVQQIEHDLAVENFTKFTITDICIARTPEGKTYVDVLDNKSNAQLNTKGKDSDTLKWEEELRAQLAQKKGQPQRKLTPDQKAKVDAQFVKEAAIRKTVLQTEEIIKRGAGIIEALAHSLGTAAEGWINVAVKHLTQLSQAGVGALVGDAVSRAYVACSDKVSLRLGNIRPFIGIAALRAFGKTYLGDELEVEPIGSLVTRVLYRIRLASEQLPFDMPSLGYFLPLLFAILDRNGIGEAKDVEGEQVLLAIEILSAHTGSCSDARLPRVDILSHLVSAMQKYQQHYKIIRDTLSDLCRCISSNCQANELKVLLDATIVPQIPVRTAALQAILNEMDLTDLDFSEHIWIERHDHVSENCDIAAAILEQNVLDLDDNSPSLLINYLASEDSQLRGAAARALAHACEILPSQFETVVETLKTYYKDEIKPKPIEKDAYGMPKKAVQTDNFAPRSGIALAFKYMANSFHGDAVVSFMRFLIDDGPLIDTNSSVRQQMAESGAAVISARGHERVERLMEMLETTLETSDKGSKESDWLNEAVIVLYGSVARHLEKGDKRVDTVIQKLLAALATPSETVQYAVAECLPPVIRLSSSNISDYVKQMLDQLLESKGYAARRGAAYGLAGIVRGKGISAIRQYRIMSRLQDAEEEKKDANKRQGAAMAYELLSLILGRIFEPYVIQIVPNLLALFGDPVLDVREAVLDAARTCFSSLSSYGVKQVLPTLLEGLDESQWRSKKGACDLLGAMAYLDPSQLAANLPEIIPPLTEVLNDTHKEVRKSADRSLQRFGEVITNPEVKSLVGVLLKALSDPTKYTDEALDSLIKVQFVHYLDAPSLALVVRILERGLSDRSATKKKSAQIIGSLAHLTERKDLIAHLPILVAGLRGAIVDPVPTTRATASKALGSLIEKLGEDALPDLIPELMMTLKSETGAGDRLGSAQALSEVLAGLGTSRLEETLPTILQNASSSKPTVREGFMSLFIFLPACFGNSFASYLNRIIPPILAGLADDIEAIRETALRAGRLLVKNFATKSIDLLLPELERGLADNNYRIRLSSVELVGDLLFNLTGIQNKQDIDEEDEAVAQAGQSLLEILGEERRNKVLSSLYICRCDTSALVRVAAINVWKALVASPRTLKDLVPVLAQLIIRRLASSNMEQKVIASNALGDLIKKAGESVLAVLLPSLEQGLLTSTDPEAKQGICIALRELIASSSTDALETYEKNVISIVRTSLVDSDEQVREAAAEAFDTLQEVFGKRIVDQMLPDLLALLRSKDDAERALCALLTLLTETTRANIILPILIPTLLTKPITAFNANALASLAEVAGSAMNRRLPTILNALMDSILEVNDEEEKEEIINAFDSIMASIDEYDGLSTIMSVIFATIKHDDERRRALGAARLAKFFSTANVDISRYYPDLVRVLLTAYDDRYAPAVKAAWEALTALVSHMRKEEMESLVIPSRNALRGVGVPGANLPGFCLPKGIGSILPIFLQGLLNGSVDQRVQSALAFCDIIDRTSPEALRPYVTQITGPLIRVVSERSSEIKAAVFLALNRLLEKIPLFVKPFLPQLQRTFARGLSDTSSDLLRKRAAKGLGILITLTPRVDPLIAELVTGSKTSDAGVKNAMLQALQGVVSKAGKNMSEASRQSILGLIDESDDDSMNITNAKLLGALVKVLPEDITHPLVKNRVVTTNLTHSSILNINALLVESPSTLADQFASETVNVLCQGISSKTPFIADNSVLAAGKFLLSDAFTRSSDTDKQVIEALVPTLAPGTPSDTRRLALVVLRTVSRLQPDLVRPHLAILAPAVFGCVRDMVIPIKLAAEGAFLSLFSVVEEESAVFTEYMNGPGAQLAPGPKRSMQDYFKRIALRLGSQSRERREAEGGQGGLGLSSDELDDEKEVWSIGKVELEETS
ncbi:translational activator of GCN4, partial [Ascosphaera pollenicola]